MFTKHFFWVLFVAFFFSVSCTIPYGDIDETDFPSSPDFGGASGNFKVPVPPGYNWEITQSWASHCEECNQKYSDWDYCELSHSWNCCKYGWDFNLPGNEDSGKPVLASSSGSVKEVGVDYGWGNYVVIDHGSNVCSRSAHLLNGSTDHLSDEMTVCQGLKIGEMGNTGDSAGTHLHFQFEECDTGNSISQSFTDGNGVPKCTRGSDVFDSRGNYDFLILTNQMVHSCGQSGDTFGGGELPEGGWYSAGCGNLPGCPLIPNCGRSDGHVFADDQDITGDVGEASAYLYSECALDGKADGRLDPWGYLTRAEALKVPLFLYGLMDNCGASEPFADVDPGDWYFGVVACAIRYGIINSVADYFQPNDEVEFAEAAKFVVEAASRAGVINIQNPSQGHFPSISSSHWAYEYVETIYHYGGLDSGALSYSPDRKLTRGNYFLMVASLSPCFCRNVSCGSGCQCDQSVFACVDPNDNSSGTGGDDPDDPDDPEDPENPEDPVEFVPNVSISCYVDEDDAQCVSPDTILQVECDVTNNGGENVNVIDLHLTMTDSAAAAVCQVTDDDYRDGVGYNIVTPGSTVNISGHFDITCSDRPADGGIDVSLDLTHAVSGPDPIFPDIAQATVSVSADPFADCYCDDRECGTNPYGGSCGSCSLGHTCDTVSGQCFCIPDCTGRECGPDFCGGFCGTSCGYGETCDSMSGQCIPDCTPDCTSIVCGWDGCGGFCDSCPTGESCNLTTSQCEGTYQNPWTNCDPTIGYDVFIESPGGSYEVLNSGSVPYESGVFPPGMGMHIHFECADMPAVIWLHGGPQYIHANTMDPSLPPLYFWVAYLGPLVIDPPNGAMGTVSSMHGTLPNASVLLRTPNP